MRRHRRGRRGRRHHEMDASFMDMLKSAGSAALSAGERMAGDAARREIARRIGE